MTDPSIASSWRSLLFVPGDKPRFIEGAPSRGADALIYDLEDSVADDRKADARAAVRSAIASSDGGPDRVVRINDSLRLAVADMDAVVQEGLAAVMVPKAESAGYIERLSGLIGELEAERHLPPESVPIVALIESPRGLSNAAELAAVPRVQALAFGPEDLCACLAATPSLEVLRGPAQSVVLAASQHAVASLGFPFSIAALEDAEGLDAALLCARDMGFTGGMAVHPAQVERLNTHFMPSAAEIAGSQLLVESATQNNGAARVDGKMVDAPVLRRARQCLARAARFGLTP